MHALGFHHEQSRPDRDTYITVNMGNIDKKKDANFIRRPELDKLGTRYDYCSIMHYQITAFGKVKHL